VAAERLATEEEIMSGGEHRALTREAAADLVAEMLGLPKLIGSPKQEPWALVIRDEKLQQIGQVRTDRRATCVRLGQNPAQIAAELAHLDAAINHLTRYTVAGWWIDRRQMSLAALLAEVGTSLPWS
jgi:hypothetical protein